MANIRVAAVASTVLAVSVSAATASVATTYVNARVTPSYPQVRLSVFIVPLTPLTAEVVTPSDFRQITVDRVSVEVVDPTDEIAFNTGKTLTDSVTVVETAFRAINSTIDFDPSDADADPDPTFAVDSDTKNVGKTLTDSNTVEDANTKVVGKASSDSVSSSETINTKHVGKSLSHEVTTNDAINTVEVDKPLTDDVTPDDAVAKSFTRPDVADAVEATDDSFRAPGLAKTDSVTAAEAINTFTVGKVSTDTVAASDAVNEFEVDKVLTDTVLMTDVITKQASFEYDDDRNDADADPDPVTVSDTQAFDVAAVRTDSVTMADAAAKDFTRPNLTDTVSGSDIPVFAADKVLADTATPADTQALAPGKGLSDSISTPADAINTFAFGKTLVDTASTFDAINVFAFSKVLTDTATMGDNAVVELFPGNYNPLIDFAFISDDKFTYFPVNGAFNEHLIHQPVVNGEFVLTTDPNAGIVYTIRTESEYTYAGYQINGNQLN